MSEPAPATVGDGSIAVILPAAGSGRRFGSSRNKLFAPLAGRPLWTYAAERLAARPEVRRVIVPVAAADLASFAEDCSSYLDRLGIEIVVGGQERSDSVLAGLDAIAEDNSVRLVAVHDAARPLIGNTDLANVFATAARTGAAILATPVVGTLKRDVGDTSRCVTVDRRGLWVALTPQVFRVDWLRRAYDRYRGWPVTDDAQLIERCGYAVSLVQGRADNLKITHPEDLELAEALLARQNHHASE